MVWTNLSSAYGLGMASLLLLASTFHPTYHAILLGEAQLPPLLQVEIDISPLQVMTHLTGHAPYESHDGYWGRLPLGEPRGKRRIEPIHRKETLAPGFMRTTVMVDGFIFVRMVKPTPITIIRPQIMAKSRRSES